MTKQLWTGPAAGKGPHDATQQDTQRPMIAPRRPPSSRPFLAAPRTDFYHPAGAIDAALHGLERAIRRSEGIGLVVGPPGTGKTLLLAKIAEHVRDDFDVALLSGARICTRRALWQSILAEIGEPYRGIDEGELRIGVVERVRGLAATGSGLVILVDEAHTLPTRLLEELRLLTNTPTPLPAVHVVLSGTTEMEERLGSSRMESLSQRIGARFYLEPLDHAETVAYLRTQMKAAGQQWDAVFEPGADDAVFSATDGVPRLINQVCDLALVTAAEAGRRRIGAVEVAAAWREIQRLPAGGALLSGCRGDAPLPREAAVEGGPDDFDGDGIGGAIVEFGAIDALDGDDATEPFEDPAEDPVPQAARGEARPRAAASPGNPWSGPEVEIVFEGDDPFAAFFGPDDPPGTVERCVVRGPDDFAARRHVASREGAALVRQLPPAAAVEQAAPPPSPAVEVPEAPHATGVAEAVGDDSDMLVVEDDTWAVPPQEGVWRVTPVRPGDYRSLFARMRRGGSAE